MDKEEMLVHAIILKEGKLVTEKNLEEALKDKSSLTERIELLMKEKEALEATIGRKKLSKETQTIIGESYFTRQ